MLIASETKEQRQSWPFVTVKDWPTKAEQLVDLTGGVAQQSSMVAVAPIVLQDMVHNWTAYVDQQLPR